MNHTAVQPPPAASPLIVQIGFAGSRYLVEPGSMTQDAEARFGEALLPALVGRLRRLAVELSLVHDRAWCGVSQVAIGADVIFTRACAELGVWQRVVLPAEREAYLSGVDESGTPDFPGAAGRQVSALLAMPHIIEERVAGHAADRTTRFEDANLQIARMSDVVVCLTRKGAREAPAGTRDVMDRALQRGRPVLDIRVGVGADGAPVLEEMWHQRAAFERPSLPADLSGSVDPVRALGSFETFCSQLGTFADQRAARRQRMFSLSAFLIIGSHVLATACAVAALILDDERLAALLWMEMGLLGVGFWIHRYMHRAHAVQRWGLCRLVAEIVRSVRAIHGVQGEPGHLFSLPLPDSLRPLLHTLSVLHLAARRAMRAEWRVVRDEYLDSRLAPQVAYYMRDAHRARLRLRWAHGTFLAASGAAFVATLTKWWMHHGHHAESLGPLPLNAALLGALAILLPLLAVAGLSLAASFGLEARAATYADMVAFLRRHEMALRSARSEREVTLLLSEAEARLLGETAMWYARRTFTGVV